MSLLKRLSWRKAAGIAALLCLMGTVVLTGSGCIARHPSGKSTPVTSPDGNVTAEVHFYNWYTGLFYIPYLGSWTPEAHIHWTREDRLSRNTIIWNERTHPSHDMPLNEKYLRIVFSPDSKMFAVLTVYGIHLIDTQRGWHWALTDGRDQIGAFAWLDEHTVGYAVLDKLNGTWDTFGHDDRFAVTFWRQAAKENARPEIVFMLHNHLIPKGGRIFMEEPLPFLWEEDGVLVERKTGNVLHTIDDGS